MKRIFCDKDGNLSAKRITGFILIISAIVFNFFGKGDPSVTTNMLYSGGICLGITAFEKKSA